MPRVSQSERSVQIVSLVASVLNAPRELSGVLLSGEGVVPFLARVAHSGANRGDVASDKKSGDRDSF